MSFKVYFIAGNSSLAEAQPPTPNEEQQLKFQPEQEVLGKQQELKEDQEPHVIQQTFKSSQHEQMQQDQSTLLHKDQPPEQDKVET